MRRRQFISLAGCVAIWPIAARAQRSGMPVIGFLNPVSPDGFGDRLRGFRQGLKETGYIEGENVAISTAGPKVRSSRFRRWRPIWSVVR
jgi:putative ABC transport system substrate-binding protein